MDGLVRFGWGLSSGAGDGVNAARFLLLTAKDALRDRSARPVGGEGDSDLYRATMTAGRGAVTAKPSGGGGERLRGREETGRRSMLFHLVLFPEGLPIFLGLSVLVGTAEEIIPTHEDLIAVRRIIGILAEHRTIERQTSDRRPATRIGRPATRVNSVFI